jgi:leucyl aminopeptidase (aminopeptidase T)
VISHRYEPTRAGRAADRVVLEVLGITAGEKVLISNDTTETLGVSHLLAGAVDQAGATPVEVLVPPTSFPGAPVALPLAEAAKASDVWIELNEHYILGTAAHFDAHGAGLRRFYSLSGVSVDELIRFELDVDRSAVIALGTRLATLTSQAKVLRVTCENGSEFIANCAGREAEPDTSTMPLGQTHISPASAEGRLVFDGSAFPPNTLGLLHETITLEFEGDARIRPEGRASQIALAWQESLGDAAIYQLNHVSYSYHPNVLFPTGRLVADERVFGSICVGLGPPQPYSCHMDLTMLSPTVEIDDVLIEERGVYLDEELRRMAADLGVAGY